MPTYKLASLLSRIIGYRLVVGPQSIYQILPNHWPIPISCLNHSNMYLHSVPCKILPPHPSEIKIDKTSTTALSKGIISTLFDQITHTTSLCYNVRLFITYAPRFGLPFLLFLDMLIIWELISIYLDFDWSKHRINFHNMIVSFQEIKQIGIYTSTKFRNPFSSNPTH